MLTNVMNGQIYLQHWPHTHQDVVDLLPRDHWFSQNYHRLIRTPTREELLSFSMPVDIIENRTEVLHQRLREALAFLLREAVREEEEGVNGGVANANEDHQPMEDILTERQEQPVPAGHRGGEAHSHPANYVNINHIDTVAGLMREVPRGGKEVQVNYDESVQGPCSKALVMPTRIQDVTNIVPSFDDCNGEMEGKNGRDSEHKHDSRTDAQAISNTHCTYTDVGTSVSASMPAVPDLSSRHQRNGNTPMKDVLVDQPAILQPVGGFHLPCVPPQTTAERAQLVDTFREQLVQELVFYQRHNKDQHPVSAHSLREAQIAEALRNNGRIAGQPYLLPENIVRHDWHKTTGDCIYTVNLEGGPHRAAAEELQNHYAGVPYTLWEYWGQRTKPRQSLVARYVDAFGTDHFYRAVMWFWLDEERWLELWQQRQVSGRA